MEKYKFDEGKSKPYFCAGSLIQFYAPNDVFNCPLNINRAEFQAEFGDEKDDLSDMSDEELDKVNRVFNTKSGDEKDGRENQKPSVQDKGK